MNRQIGTQVTDRYEELPSKPTQNPVTDYAEFPSFVALFFFSWGKHFCNNCIQNSYYGRNCA